MAGFTFRYRLCGAPPTIQDLTFHDTETLTRGDILNLETGEVDLGVAADTGILGAAQETVVGTDSVSKIQVITDYDAVYGVVNANARAIGATLDLSGTTGAQGVTTSSSATFIVVANSSATEETLVKVNQAAHWLFTDAT